MSLGGSVYLFFFVVGGYRAININKGDGWQKLLPLYLSQSFVTTSSTFKI